MTRFLFRISSQGMELVDALIKSMPRHCQWKGGTWSELNRTKVYSIVKKLSSAKVGNPLYLNSSHVVRAKPLHGVTNSPGRFQKRMNKLLLEFIDKFIIVYMDDILIFSKNLHEHIGHIRQVLLALAGANMILNIEKCKFFQTETRFLGHILSRHGSRPDPRNIEKVMAWPTPRTITDVRGFCNLAGHYRRYIPKFADMSLPLTDLMKGSPAKGAKIRWTGGKKSLSNNSRRLLHRNPSSVTHGWASHSSSTPILHNIALAQSSNSLSKIPMERHVSILSHTSQRNPLRLNSDTRRRRRSCLQQNTR